MRVAILLFPGVEEMDFSGPLEVFGAARKLGAHLDIDLIAPDSTLVCAFGLVVANLAPLATARLSDVLIVPGGSWIGATGTGARAASENEEILQCIRETHARGAIVASVCTGAFLLAAAGLLDGISAATHHAAADDLRARGVRVVPSRVADAGSILTAGGVTSGLELSLHLVERLLGPEIARKVEAYLEYEPRPVCSQ